MMLVIVMVMPKAITRLLESGRRLFAETGTTRNTQRAIVTAADKELLMHWRRGASSQSVLINVARPHYDAQDLGRGVGFWCGLGIRGPCLNPGASV